jgi:hypothetical protein
MDAEWLVVALLVALALASLGALLTPGQSALSFRAAPMALASALSAG